MMELYDQALHLPVKWHQDHHSGVIISRIRKAYEALKDFFQNGFMYIHALAKVPQPAGKTLLDRACIYGTSEYGEGWQHGEKEHPVVLAGGAGGRMLHGGLDH